MSGELRQGLMAPCPDCGAAREHLSKAEEAASGRAWKGPFTDILDCKACKNLGYILSDKGRLFALLIGDEIIAAKRRQEEAKQEAEVPY